MNPTLLVMLAVFVAGAVFGYAIREGISRRRHARERHTFYYDDRPYGDAPLVPGWQDERQNTEGSKTVQRHKEH